jgi:hypothetical protein
MSEQTLAETLRELQQRRDEKQAAEQAFVAVLSRVPDDMRVLAVQEGYLRGHDDRQPEIDALQARVRELESTVLDEHSRLAQEEAKPAPTLTYRFTWPTGYSAHMTVPQYERACQISHDWSLPHNVEVSPVYGLKDAIGIHTGEMLIVVLPDGSSHS